MTWVVITDIHDDSFMLEGSLASAKFVIAKRNIVFLFLEKLTAVGNSSPCRASLKFHSLERKK